MSVAEARPEPIRVFSRAGCHLCEELIEQLLPLVRGRLDIDVLDIDTRDEWTEAYGLRIPVVEYKSQFVCQFSLDESAIQRILEDHVGS